MKGKDDDLRGLLPWYINGTLESETHDRMQWSVQQSGGLRSEAAWLEQLRARLHEAKFEAATRPADAGLDKLMALVSGERSGQVLRFPWRTKRAAAVSSAGRRSPLLLGMAAALVLAQTAVIGMLLASRPPELLPLAGQGPQAAQVLQVSFRPEASDARIRAALAAVEGDIVSGPGALGIYSIRVPEGQAEAALVKLRASRTVVESALLVQSR
ncbi:MAG: hypothetical protein JWQ72_3017 [Polaromonas sp.]|nr:hypothetical protein [Polaromonas sp.]